MPQVDSASAQSRPPMRIHDEHAVLRMILEGTATYTGERFFAELVKSLAAALDTHGAWVTEYVECERHLHALAFWMGGQFVPEFDMPIDNTPCERVIVEMELVHYPDNIVALYPGDNDLEKFNAQRYMGVPLLDADRRIIGHLAVLDTKPMPAEPHLYAVFRIFAARASAELQRLRAEQAVRERETKLHRIIHGAMDAIIELDEDLNVTLVNPAAEKAFGAPANEMLGRSFRMFLTEQDAQRLADLISTLDERPEGAQQVWVAGGLTARRRDGAEFAAEATVSRMVTNGRDYHTLVLRNVNDRIEAERKIETLTVETRYLREELREIQNHGAIFGESPAMRTLMEELMQVADTDATVLVLGETGTGKELIARAIHAASRRKDGPLIRVNCAAIPAMLIESEFFGHEKGAFTGATAKREGRFSLAHDGTIFLDEVGEIPPDLQSKLLRVLQEGEFEPVGSSHTQRVNVRVIAATNRDLDDAVREGRFREDLFYRLNVFPLHVPPLRERGDDVVLLAKAFAERFAKRMGRPAPVLTPTCAQRLKAYSWPGNVRELQNVVERAVITVRDNRLNLDRSLPDVSPDYSPQDLLPDRPARILSSDDLLAIERANILRALESANWKVAGKDGAAACLGMKPSTLASRMKALNISRKSPAP